MPEDIVENVAPQTVEHVETESERVARIFTEVKDALAHIAENTGRTASDIAELKAMQTAREALETAREATEDTLESGKAAVEATGGAAEVPVAAAEDVLEDTQKVIEKPHKRKKRRFF